MKTPGEYWRWRIDNNRAVGKNTKSYSALDLWRFFVAYGAPSIEEFKAGAVVKYAPISTGTTTQRKRKPHIMAVINE